MRLKPNQRLGDYEILASIGAGGMGEVYSARDTRLDRKVAIKVLPGAGDPQKLARFQREARAVAALSHPNILAIHDVGAEGSIAYVVTELLEGETLRERLEQGAIAPRKAAELGRQVARGLAAAHDKGIVHRDLKPENLFVTDEGRMKILDFGLAVMGDEQPDADSDQATRTSLTLPGTVLGTVGYMSPEQVRGAALDHRSDIFSFGAVLYEMIGGSRPFARETPAESMTAILKEEPADLMSVSGEIPPALATIVRRCMEKSVGERFHSAHDLAFSLEALSEITVASGSAAAMPDSGDKSGSRRPGVWTIAGVLGGLLVGALAMNWLRPPEVLEPPTFTRLSSRRGSVLHARFEPGALTTIYSATWEGKPLQLFESGSTAGAATELPLTGVDLLSISTSGELALSLDRRFPIGWEAIGTLAVAKPDGSAPRPILEDVLVADWDPAGAELAVAREVNGIVRLEYPIGNVLYESPGWISDLRFHPDGDRIAFADNPYRGDNTAAAKIVDLQGTVEHIVRGASWGLAWTPDGEQLLHGGGTSLYATRPGEERRVIHRSPTSLRVLDMEPSGGVLVAASAIRRELIGRAPGTDTDVNLSWLDWSTPKALLPDGSAVLFEEGNAVSNQGYAFYIRRTDGSPPTQIGDGTVIAVSADGRWVVAIQGWRDETRKLTLMPTGPGEPRYLPIGEIRPGAWGAAWIPGSGDPDAGGAIVMVGRDAGAPARLFRIDLDGKTPPRPISPEGLVPAANPVAVSPDGQQVVVMPTDGAPVRFPIAGGDAQPVPGARVGDRPIRYDRDGRHLYVLTSAALPAKLVRIDTTTGERSPWRELVPPDSAGAFSADYVQLSDDGSAHVYSLRRTISSLLRIDGIRWDD